ncbi:hypothetical protein NKJ46_33945 [Mesorhizobium sp. M0166]|uniref:hypothetical protein n=1 Tax=unclassified Mesorhizobium TaxID=325217 RepID=UPI00333C8E01
MEDGSSSPLGIIISWLPMVLMLGVFGYFVMKLLRVQRGSVAALEAIAQKLSDIDARLAKNAAEPSPPDRS